MAGPWLYAINCKKNTDSWFEVRGKRRIPTTFENYRKLVENEHLGDDPTWNIWRNGKDVKRQDEIFIYTGDKDRGIIGYAIVEAVSADYKTLRLNFDYDLCRSFSEMLPVPAQEVRSWKQVLRPNLIDLGPVEKQLRRALSNGFAASTASEAFEGSQSHVGHILTGVAKALAPLRLGQQRVRKQCLHLYGRCCAVCDISDPKLLIASHIVRWADSPKDRGDPSNVICLCRIHDALFDAGYWSLDDKLKILTNKRSECETISNLILAMHKFKEPLKFSPEPRFVKRHRKLHGFNRKS